MTYLKNDHSSDSEILRYLSKKAFSASVSWWCIYTLNHVYSIGYIKVTICSTLPDFAQFSVMIPFPGTDIYELYMKSGHVTSNWDDYIYASLKSASTPVFETGMLSKEELQAWNGRAYKEFYFRRNYIWQRLIGMRSVGDLNTNLGGFSMFLEMMRE